MREECIYWFDRLINDIKGKGPVGGIMERQYYNRYRLFDMTLFNT